MKLDQNLCKNGDRTKLLPYTNFYIEAFTCDMTLRSYFGNQNSTLGSVVPLVIFDLVLSVSEIFVCHKICKSELYFWS